MSYFERREWEDNTWQPEVAGVDFTHRLHKFMGDVALDGTEIYTAWLVTDDEQEIQITPDNSRAFVSLTDDESDTVTIQDPSDGLWFHFMRVTHREEFQDVLNLIMPWSMVTSGIIPPQEVYTKYLEVVSRDASDDFIPDDWK